MTASHHGQPPHRRWRMAILVAAAIVSVSVWLAVLFWNGCVGNAPSLGSVDSPGAQQRGVVVRTGTTITRTPLRRGSDSSLVTDAAARATDSVHGVAK